MLQATPKAEPPASEICVTTASHASSLRLATTTFAPAVANPRATDEPRPREPPVTMATRPVRSNSEATSSEAMAGECSR